MTRSSLIREEVARLGKAIYQQRIRPQVEMVENIGKVISIDVETGEYAIGTDSLVTCRQLQAKHPDAAIWTERIGFDAVYEISESLEMRPEYDLKSLQVRGLGTGRKAFNQTNQT